MNFEQGKELQPYWDLVLANISADVLRVAIEWDLFRHLDRPGNANDLAKALGLDPVNVSYLLDMLWSMELLSRDSEKIYLNKEVARKYFCSDSVHYLGDAFLFRLKGLRHFGNQIGGLVRFGVSHSPAEVACTIQENWAKAADLHIAQEQRAVTATAVTTLISNISAFKSGGRLLDLGGGPGLIAIAILKLCPKLYGEIFDFPETIKVAQRNINQAGLTERLQVKGGDLVADSIGENFDLIWCSSVLHFVPDIDAILAKIWTALKPGGLFISAHAEVPLTAKKAIKVLPYYLSMQMRQCNVMSIGELSLALQKSGFIHIEQYEDIAFPVTPVNVLVARKEEI